MAGSRPGETSQGDLGKVKIARIAEETLVTVKVDRRALGDGHGQLCEQSVVSVAKRDAGVKAHQ